MKNIKENNRKIADFMGYEHYHSGIDIDDGTVGGIYNRFEIFSKTPILAEEYPEDDQYYFASVPNPDYGEKGKTWRHDLKTLSWASLNEFIYDVKYHEKWGWLMPVAKKINDTMSAGEYYKSPHMHSDLFSTSDKLQKALSEVDLDKVYKYVVEFIDAYHYDNRCYAEDVNYKGLVLCAQKGCPEESNEYSKYCNDCYDEKYPAKT